MVVLGSVRIDSFKVEQRALCVKANNFASCAETRVNAHHSLLTQWSCKKELTQIFSKHFYCFIIGILGFIASTIILAVAILIFYGARKWYYYAIPIAMVGIVYYVFGVLLHISLP